MNATLSQQLRNLTGLGIGLVAFMFYAVYFSPTQGWVFFFQLTVNGIILGSVYALIALGYSMVYGILKLLNFAHGDVYMIGAFIGFGVLTLLGGPLNPEIPVALLVLCMFVVAMLGSGFLGLAIERFAYRPLRDAPRIAPLISALGVSFFLANSMQLLFGAQPRNYDTFDIHNAVLYTSGFDIGNVHMPLLRVITIVMTVPPLLLGLAAFSFPHWSGEAAAELQATPTMALPLLLSQAVPPLVGKV